MAFPYERYAQLSDTFTLYYPRGEEVRARRQLQSIKDATALLSQLLKQPVPAMQILVVAARDWSRAPREELEEGGEGEDTYPYWTEQTSPPSLVIPLGAEKALTGAPPNHFSFVLYHPIMLAFLESDERPWPEDYPLWADEWQLKFAALWLTYRLNGQKGMVNQSLRDELSELFEPEDDGKTPITIRGFDWDEDTEPDDYLAYSLLHEQFAADLLARYDPEVLPRFLALYRTGRDILYSKDVTTMLVEALGPGGSEWLEALVYF